MKILLFNGLASLLLVVVLVEAAAPREQVHNDYPMPRGEKKKTDDQDSRGAAYNKLRMLSKHRLDGIEPQEHRRIENDGRKEEYDTDAVEEENAYHHRGGNVVDDKEGFYDDDSRENIGNYRKPPRRENDDARYGKSRNDDDDHRYYGKVHENEASYGGGVLKDAFPQLAGRKDSYERESRERDEIYRKSKNAYYDYFYMNPELDDDDDIDHFIYNSEKSDEVDPIVSPPSASAAVKQPLSDDTTGTSSRKNGDVVHGRRRGKDADDESIEPSPYRPRGDHRSRQEGDRGGRYDYPPRHPSAFYRPPPPPMHYYRPYYSPYYPPYSYPHHYYGFPYSYNHYSPYGGYYSSPAPPALTRQSSPLQLKADKEFKCESDGYVYRDPYSFYHCYDDEHAVQYCAAGSMNMDDSFYQKTDRDYTQRDFCAVNMASVPPAFTAYPPPPAAYSPAGQPPVQVKPHIAPPTVAKPNENEAKQ